MKKYKGIFIVTILFVLTTYSCIKFNELVEDLKEEIEIFSP
jgi:hypothetical protein